MIVRKPWLSLVVLLAVGCGDGKGGTEGTTDGGSSGTATSSSTSETPTTGATTGDGTGTGTGGGSTGSSGSGSSTGVDVSGFERFTMNNAAGPCGPDSDCDGFVELLSTGILRVETFGDITDAVLEVAISAEDFAAAVPVFADPALVAVLDGPDPLCNPPTDIFESMEVVIDGSSHDATTTACGQAPLTAAREMAQALRTEYVP